MLVFTFLGFMTAIGCGPAKLQLSDSQQARSLVEKLLNQRKSGAKIDELSKHSPTGNSNLLFLGSHDVCFFTSNLDDLFLLGIVCIAIGLSLFAACRMARRCFQRASMDAVATL